MGQVYMQVSAEVANGGIMTMAASGGGSTGGSYYISWTPEGGFTGTGWLSAWNSNNVPLQRAWTTNPGPAEGYTANYDGFISYVGSSGVDNLNSWLDNAPVGWSDEQKYAFAHDENDGIVWMNCTSPA